MLFIFSSLYTVCLIYFQFYDTKDRYGNTCWWVIIARGSGGCLNLLCSFLALTMCRDAVKHAVVTEQIIN